MLPATKALVLKRSFSPRNLPGLVAWYRADIGVYSDAGVTPATDGGTVQQWNDLSGNNCHMLQATALNRPVFQVAGFNGNRPTVSFTAASSQFMTTAVGVPMGSDVTGSACFVGQMLTGTASNGRILTYCKPTTNTDYQAGGWQCLVRNVTNANITAARPVTGIGMTATGYLATNIRQFCVFDGVGGVSYKDNAIVSVPTTAAGATVTGGYLGMGHGLNAGGTDGTAYFSGLISEVFVTNRALTSVDRQNLMQWMARW